MERAYTPTSLTDDKGTFELVIKVYPNGKVTEHLFNMKEGDEIMVKGPFPKFKYVPNMKKRLGMLCGGTGIAPMLQVIKEVLRNPDDKTEISLVFANETFEDILLKSTLDELAGKHTNFKGNFEDDCFALSTILSIPYESFSCPSRMTIYSQICRSQAH